MKTIQQTNGFFKVAHTYWNRQLSDIAVHIANYRPFRYILAIIDHFRTYRRSSVILIHIDNYRSFQNISAIIDHFRTYPSQVTAF